MLRLRTLALLGVFAALAFHFLFNFLPLLNVGRRVFNHEPGQCHFISPVVDGSEDLELLPDGILLISSGLRYMQSPELANVRGVVFAYEINQSPPTYKAKKVSVKGSIDPEKFNPHGLSSYTEKGKSMVYMISHEPEGEVIYVFEWSKAQTSLSLLRSIRSPLFHGGLNDVVVVGKDKLYATQDFHYKHPMARQVEILGMFAWGTLVYIDGEKVSVVDERRLTPNGIAASTDKKDLYVASPMTQSIFVYAINANGSLTHRGDLHLGTMPDNIVVEESTGDLWVGCHPIGHELFGHFDHPKTKTAPSHVLRLRLNRKDLSWEATEPFANDGKTGPHPLSASSIGLPHGKSLMVGTLAHKLLHCHAS